MRNIVNGFDDPSLSRLGWLSLQEHSLTLGLGFSLLSSIGLDSVQEFLTTSGVLNVLDSQVDSLFEVSVSNNLVNNDTDRRLGDVVNNTGLTVVVLVGHTLLDGTVGLDVDDISNLVGLHIGGQWDGTMLLEITLEGVTSTRSVTMTELVFGVQFGDFYVVYDALGR